MLDEFIYFTFPADQPESEYVCSEAIQIKTRISSVCIYSCAIVLLRTKQKRNALQIGGNSIEMARDSVHMPINVAINNICIDDEAFNATNAIERIDNIKILVSSMCASMKECIRL